MSRTAIIFTSSPLRRPYLKFPTAVDLMLFAAFQQPPAPRLRRALFYGPFSAFLGHFFSRS